MEIGCVLNDEVTRMKNDEGNLMRGTGVDETLSGFI